MGQCEAGASDAPLESIALRARGAVLRTGSAQVIFCAPSTSSYTIAWIGDRGAMLGQRRVGIIFLIDGFVTRDTS